MDLDRFLKFFEKQKEQRSKVLPQTQEEIDLTIAAHCQICEDCGKEFMPKHGEKYCGGCRWKQRQPDDH